MAKTQRRTDEATIEYERVFGHVASFGTYQKALYCAVNFLVLPISLQFGNLLFSFGAPAFHCVTPNITCPTKKCCANCTAYTFDGPFTSIVNEWDLVCKRAYIAATTQAIFFVGMTVGSVLSGMLSDAIGRKISLGLNSALMMVFSFAASFANSYPLLTVLQFFVGATLTGTMLSIYTYGMEIIGPDKRTLAGNANEVFWTVGNTMIVVIAYFIRDWRWYMRISGLPSILFLVFWRLLPETPRWLIAHGRLEEARDVLIKYGSCSNTKSLDPEMLGNLIHEIRENQLHRARKRGKGFTILDLFRTPKMRKWTLILGFNWFVIGLSSFGFVLYVTALAGDLYLNFSLLQIVLPTVQIAPVWFILHRFGRRIPHFCILLLAGLVCLLIIPIPKRYSMVLTGISVLGKSLVGSGWTTVYLITSESYPTILRNTALGTGSLCGRLGAMIAPYVAMMAQLPSVSLTVPVIIFGGVAVVASVTSLWIPETHYAPMPQTIEEAENREDFYGIPCCLKSVELESSENISPEEWNVDGLVETQL
ncbi:organic cation transporter protein isoform X2 [Nematostella vectensis]|nr:organic cation transporter protein isoform X2 [Nematostella vectensis]